MVLNCTAPASERTRANPFVSLFWNGRSGTRHRAEPRRVLALGRVPVHGFGESEVATRVADPHRPWLRRVPFPGARSARFDGDCAWVLGAGDPHVEHAVE